MDEFKRLLADIHQRHQVAADYQKTLALLRALKSGAVSIDQIAMTADGWQVLDVQIEAPPAEEPAEPKEAAPA